MDLEHLCRARCSSRLEAARVPCGPPHTFRKYQLSGDPYSRGITWSPQQTSQQYFLNSVVAEGASSKAQGVPENDHRTRDLSRVLAADTVC